MSQLADKNGVSVTVERDDEAGEFTISLEGHGVVGKSLFFDADPPASERFFYHTEVSPDFSGRGLAGILLGESLKDAREHELTVVAICPFYAAHLNKRGDEYTEQGGKYRKVTPSEISEIQKRIRGE